MENKLSAPVPGIDMSFCGRYVRRHSSSTGATPPRSPTFLIHKPPSNPDDLSFNRSFIYHITQNSQKDLIPSLLLVTPIVFRFSSTLLNLKKLRRNPSSAE